MTCIIGLKHGNSIYIAGDSGASTAWDMRPTSVPKVFISGSFIIGYSTSFRVGQLLQYQFSPPEKLTSQTDEQYMVVSVVEHMRHILRDGGAITTENGKEIGAFVLIGYGGNLYKIQSDYSCMMYPSEFDAIGSGEDFALAAMEALENLEPEQRLTRSLEITAKYSNYVSAPFVTERLTQ